MNNIIGKQFDGWGDSMFRQAKSDDIPVIMDIIKKTIVEMQAVNNPQWGEHYPQGKDFLADIEQGWLYVLERNGVVVAFVSLNTVQGKSYPKIQWQDNSTALVMRRLGVDNSLRRSGIATTLLGCIEDFARRQNISVLKMDTFCRNEEMNKFAIKHGFIHRATLCILDIEEPFFFYEKILNKNNLNP